VNKSASQYQALLATVRPRDLAGRTRRRMATEELEDLGRLDAKLKAMKAELKTAVQAMGSHLMDIHGIGPAGAARILADAGDVARFPDRNHFRVPGAGTAPIDASSGQHLRHRLSRAGNRRPSHVLYMAAFAQIRRHPRPGLLPAQARRQEDPDGSDALPAPSPPGRRLPAARRRRPGTRHRKGRPGRAPRGVCVIQRGRPSPGHRHFGSATARTRTPDATPTPPSATGHGPRSRHPRRRARGVNVSAPHRTNDVDTGQRRRPLKAPGPHAPLDKRPT
jgi:transposase